MKLEKLDFPGNQFVQEETPKDLFVIHHSAGWDDARNMFHIWAKSEYRVCTAYGISDNGTVYQGFDTKCWGYAINVDAGGNRVDPKFKTPVHDDYLNSRAIQVEICSWGALKERNGKLYAWPAYSKNNWLPKYEVPKSKACYYPGGFRGFYWFEKYTDEEIAALRALILKHHKEDGIPLHYNEDMWDISEKALSGEPGIWSHVSFRSDKSDAHPQPELIEMLKGLC
jgi:hypothetical protein